MNEWMNGKMQQSDITQATQKMKSKYKVDKLRRKLV